MVCLKTWVLTLASIAVLAFPAQCQKIESGKITIRIDEIDRLGQNCTVDAASEEITYKLVGRTSAACTLLSAGNEYKAERATLKNPNNSDYETLVISIMKDGEKAQAGLCFRHSVGKGRKTRTLREPACAIANSVQI
jgi:hypothetical protein